MYSQSISCTSLASSVTKASFGYHQLLGSFHTDWHQHASGQLVYAENGFIHLHVAGKRLLLPGWYAAWIPSNTMHEIWSHSPQLIMRSISFPETSLQQPALKELSVFSVSPLLKEMIRYTEKWHQLSEETIQETTFLQSLLYILPDEIENSFEAYLPDTKHEKLSLILAFVQQHLDEKIGILFLAQHFGYSSRNLTRLFNAHLGMSFSSYCKVARMLKALEIIEKGEDNVSQVAFQVGYESLATFSNNFLEVCGHRPTYLIQHKKQKGSRQRVETGPHTL